MTNPSRPIIVVGAGLAGLNCALHLQRWGQSALVLEAGDAVGGRVRSDVIRGFTIDRGFQVLNTAYPAVRTLDLATLQLRNLPRGVRLQRHGRIHDLVHPAEDLRAAANGLVRGPLKVRHLAALARHGARLLATRPAELARRADEPSGTAWRRTLPDAVVDELLTPFFTGVLLESEMESSRVFTDLMTRAFLTGRSALPHRGMQALPERLAALLAPGKVHLETPVASVSATSVTLEDGRDLEASAVVVATDPWTAHRLVPTLGEPPQARSVTTYYHAAPTWPQATALLAVDADDTIANSVVLTQSAPSYATDGRELIATSVLHDQTGQARADAEAAANAAAQLHQTTAREWELIATRRIPRALPAMPGPHPIRRSIRVPTRGLWVAGDHRDTSSIQGALVSGRRAAASVIAATAGTPRNATTDEGAEHR